MKLSMNILYGSILPDKKSGYHCQGIVAATDIFCILFCSYEILEKGHQLYTLAFPPPPFQKIQQK